MDKIILDEFKKKMSDEGLPEEALKAFEYYYGLLCEGATGKLSEKDILPVKEGSVSHLDSLDEYNQAGEDLLDKTALIKLNGGLGTSMGMNIPKALLKIDNDKSFFDVILKQTDRIRNSYGVTLPLLFMNSFNTHDYILKSYPEIAADPTGSNRFFIQHKFPKINKSDLRPASSPQNPALEWAPPGHGDIFAALTSSGMLERLINEGIKYIFISNIDNLGAQIDLRIPGYMEKENINFLIEAARRTPSDKKGGHLALKKEDKSLILREIAQTEPEDIDSFQDIKRHFLFNTNNIWINLPDMQKFIEESGGVIKLPLVCNQKNLDPRDPESPGVIQLESTMGSAVSYFNRAGVVEVPRTRFAPVKTCDDLIFLRSDCFGFDNDFNPVINNSGIKLSFDKAFYGKYDQLDERFPSGIPSLRECSSLTVEGDVRFGSDVKITGSVKIANHTPEQKSISDGMVINENIDL